MLGVFGGILAQKVLKPWSPAAQPQLQLVQDLTNSRLFYLVQTDSKNCFIAGVQQIYIVHQMFASCLNFTWRSWSHKLCLFFTKFSPGFHQVFTRFLDVHWVSEFHQVFARSPLGLHQVFTRFLDIRWVSEFHQVFTRFSGCSLSFWISPGFHHVSGYSLSCQISPSFHQVSKKIIRFSPSLPISPFCIKFHRENG